MLEGARLRLSFKAPWRSDSSANRRIRSVCDSLQLSGQTARGMGPRQVPERDELSAPCVGRLSAPKGTEVLHGSSAFRRLVAQPALRVPKPDV